MNRPDAVVDFLESDGVLLQRVGDEEQALLEPKRSGVRDALHDEMAGILDRRQCAAVEPRRRPIPRRGRSALEELVRPLVVVEVDNPTPIVPSYGNSITRGIRGSGVPSPYTKCSSSRGILSVGAASRRNGIVYR